MTTMIIRAQLKRRGGRCMRIIPDAEAENALMRYRDPKLIEALVRAHLFQRKINAGYTMKDIAKSHNLTRRYVRKIMMLNFLPPKLKMALLDDAQETSVVLYDLVNGGVDLVW